MTGRRTSNCRKTACSKRLALARKCFCLHFRKVSLCLQLGTPIHPRNSLQGLADRCLTPLRPAIFAHAQHTTPFFPLLLHRNNDVYPDYNMTACNSEGLFGLYQLWSQWIPMTGVDDFLKFGGYEQPIARGNLRVLSLNTIFYHTRNTAYQNTDDPCGQMAWMRKKLARARSDGARVYLAGHIPPKAIVTSPSQASQFWWSKHQEPFLDILHEFSDVIASSLWGHTHTDEFWTDTRDSSVVGGLITPSITSLQSQPSYRVVDMDADSFDVVDYTHRSVNLKAANRANKYNVQTVYRYSTAYGLPDATPASLNTLRQKILTNSTAGDTFLHNWNAGYADSLNAIACSTVSSQSEYWACRYSC